MGRPRKPTSLKVLDGDRPDRIPSAEPTSPPGLGEAPDWLDPIGKATWSRMADLLEPMALATRADREAITLYCVTYSTWHQAMGLIATEGLTVETATCIKPHPCFAIVHESQRQLARMLSRFGLTPSDRAGLHVQGKPEEDELLRFLARPTAATPDAKRKKSHR